MSFRLAAAGGFVQQRLAYLRKNRPALRGGLVAASLLGAAALAATVILCKPGLSGADPVKPAEPAAKPASALPIGKVVLYSSGVGYFQREGKVLGNARVDLSFQASDINDLLKSMVLRDMNGGHVSAVSYDSTAPVEKTLASFAVNLNNNPGFGQILNQARGERVEVTLVQSNAGQPGTLTGAVLGIEKVKQTVGKDAVAEVEQLNLWCAEGMRSVKLADVQRVRFLNPVIEGELKKALETLALSHDTQKKAVSLSFSGEGEREVRVGYVVENPIWKTSYRLVLGKEGKPFLQGWAAVDNASDEDWSDVGMVLVSGRPISFRMDLYTPLYVPRPLVEPELFASLRPVAYEGGFRHDGDKAAQKGEPSKKVVADSEARQRKAADRDEALAKDPKQAGGEQLRRELAERMDPSQGVRSAATASALGDFFQYAIDQPVSLARQKSALLPIVNKDVDAERVSIYNPATHPKFPLLGLRFKNTTGLHLSQGPITVFEGSAYAGDARVLDVAPGDERLLSYAVDLAAEVEQVNDNPRHTVTKVKVSRGVIHTTARLVESRTYKVQTKADTDRTVLIEHPYRQDFKVTSKEQPIETAGPIQRFVLKVPAGKQASLTVVEEKDVADQVVITNSNDDTIRTVIDNNVTSAAAKEALKKAIELKNRVATTGEELNHLDKQRQDLERDQARIRENMKGLPEKSELFGKYLAELTKQENEAQAVREQIKQKRDAQLQQQKDYDAFLLGLDLE